MSEQKRVIYTKEELAVKVKVPAIVEQDLKRIISDRLEQCGLYYRCFSRIKTASSCLLYTSPSPRDRQKSRMPSSA